MCGENRVEKFRLTLLLGSPPRVRGKLGGIIRAAQGVRITPACAGKTSACKLSDYTIQDHPRVCGENGPALCDVREHLGSPPRVRGKPSSIASALRPLRITPACAGKTTLRYRDQFSAGDHPRVCGENPPVCAPYLRRLGSPPRVRGKLSPETQMKEPQRITPACAGKTGHNATSECCTKDHPRVCGENTSEMAYFRG